MLVVGYLKNWMRSSTLSFWLSLTEPAAKAFFAILPLTSCGHVRVARAQVVSYRTGGTGEAGWEGLQGFYFYTTLEEDASRSTAVLVLTF